MVVMSSQKSLFSIKKHDSLSWADASAFLDLYTLFFAVGMGAPPGTYDIATSLLLIRDSMNEFNRLVKKEKIFDDLRDILSLDLSIDNTQIKALEGFCLLSLVPSL